MSDIVAIAFGAVSALGEGEDALSRIELGRPAISVVRKDAELSARGLAKTSAARAREPSSMLECAMAACVRELDASRPAWRSLRVGLVLGTSSGSMREAERAYEALARGEIPSRADARSLAYASPTHDAERLLGVRLARRATILAACASSTVACAVASAWLARDECDLVFVAGFDGLTTFVASGFSALSAVSATSPRAFREGRDGLGLGEGAVVAAFVRADDARETDGHLVVSGACATSDALHVTAPDREARGLGRAIERALRAADVRPDAVDLVSAHATSTPFNDASEWTAFARTFGDVRARAIPIHAMKDETGHSFGAAGLLESLSIARAMRASVALPSPAHGAIDPASPARLLATVEAHPSEIALKTSLAFGGLNAVLVLRRTPRPSSHFETRQVVVEAAEGHADPSVSVAELATKLGLSADRIARVDALTRLVLHAVSRLRDSIGAAALVGAGIVVGHDAANVATNALYVARYLARGPRFAEPRRFPYTSPNACAGEASIVFGLVGPAFAVGGAPGDEGEALEVARDLVSVGSCDSLIVVEVSERSAASEALFAAWERPAREPFARARLVRASAK